MAQLSVTHTFGCKLRKLTIWTPRDKDPARLVTSYINLDLCSHRTLVLAKLECWETSHTQSLARLLGNAPPSSLICFGYLLKSGHFLAPRFPFL